MKQILTFRIFTIILLMLSITSVSCSTSTSRKKKKFQGFGKELDQQAPAWAKAVHRVVLKLGNYNWIVVAEPAFPALNREGITTLTVNATSPEVLEQIFSSLETNGHVDANLYFSKESRFLSESETPGIQTFKAQMDKALNGREARSLEHSALELLLMDAKKKYRILIIKTNTLLPYSSVFIELESGYWDGVSETALRKRMLR